MKKSLNETIVELSQLDYSYREVMSLVEKLKEAGFSEDKIKEELDRRILAQEMR